MVTIELHGIGKRFGEFVALHDINLRIARGELIALLGPSGSGKTTLLRIIAGLEWPDRGDVRFDGETAAQRGAHERRVGFVFQHYALFRHMRVLDNIAFGLRVRPRAERPPAKEIRSRVEELLRLVQMDRLADRYPAELSGGQRQRVALARALAIEPRVLLLDEPFGALDAKVRQELRRWLRRLHEDTGVTSIFVTHDQEEALELADRVVVMNQGRIEQVGTTAEIYENPANPFVYQFLGRTIRLTCEARGGWAHHPGIALEGVRAKAAASVAVYVRPHDMRVRSDPNGRAVVRVVADAGATVRLELAVKGEQEPVEAEMPREQFACLGIGTGARVELSAVRGKVFEAETPEAELVLQAI